jgi:hypothetical protein
MSRRNGLSIVNLGHSPDTSASQTRILVAVSPTVHRSLNQSSLAAKARVQLSQSPAHRVALSLVNKTVASILIFATASSWIDTILRFEFGIELVYIH